MASGGSFAKYSHEFQTLTAAGEDIIYIDEQTKEAVNEEIIDDKDLGYDKNKLRKEKAVEVGNIFTLGTKYSEVLGLQYQDDQGNKRPVFMGSYGIGPARVMGTIAELFADEKGLVWPPSVAPFLTHLLCLSDSVEEADALYEQLQSVGIEVLYDDRHGMSAGEKFADADLIGIPWRLVISDKTLASKSAEVKERQSKEIELVSLRELPNYLQSKIS